MRFLAFLTLSLFASSAYAQSSQGQGRIFNTVKTKLAQGKQVVGGTVSSNDPDVYCAMANSGFDFTWIEMQHSTLTYQEVARMIWACRGAQAMPFIRIPDSTEGDIQKATDLGAVGIIIPMVESLDKVHNAIKFASYPPRGKRSQGGGQYGALWGSDYRQRANDNMMIVAMIESPAGVELAEQIAAIPEVDVVFVASTDLGSGRHKDQERRPQAQKGSRRTARVEGRPRRLYFLPGTGRARPHRPRRQTGALGHSRRRPAPRGSCHRGQRKEVATQSLPPAGSGETPLHRIC
jgi:2-keto-3-deoxy-L-rhamnonate aldolase RhmA